MLKRLKIVLIIVLSVQLWGEDYTINVKKGWQLIGLPTTVDSMRIFNNSNVRLVWSYNGEYSDWEGYSPEKSLVDKLYEHRINILTKIERWQGIWVQSYSDWELTVSDNTALYENAPDINKLYVYKGWNLLSIPFDTVLSPKIFEKDGYKLWKYSKNYEWQTNQEYDFLDFPEVDELNSKRGFWLYSPEYREVDLSQKSGEFFIDNSSVDGEYLSQFNSIDEVQKYIEKNLVVNSRENQYWNWTVKQDIYSSTEESVETFPTIENSITNNNGVNIRFSGIEEPSLLKEYSNYLFFRGKNSVCDSSVTTPKDTIVVGYIDDILEGSSFDAYCFTPNFQTGTSSIDNFIISNNRLMIFSTLVDAKQNPTFSQRCREKRSVVSIYDLTLNPVGRSDERHIFIDGEMNNSRVINNSLYLLTKFEPCVDIDYPKEYLSNSDPCAYPEDTIEYKTKCYDVETDDEDRLFRYDYEFPYVQNIYSLPKYLYSGDTTWRDLISPENFYATPKIDQKSSLLSLSHINLINGTIQKNTTVLGEIGNIHISRDSLYLVSTENSNYISFRDTKAKSSIYKFNFYPVIEYRASGEIEGKIYSPFWLSEMRSDESTLRVASKDKISWGESSGNRVEVLQDRDGQLQRVGRILNVVNEAYSFEGIKFYGDIAIASTNSSKQPFQIINLKDIANPRKGDTISILGKSDYIHFSESDSRLISVGRDVEESGIDGGIRVDVFNTSNLDSISNVGSLVLGDYHNFTPISLNREALGYRSSDGALAIPLYTDGGFSTDSVANGLHVFNLNSLDSGEVKFETNDLLSIPTMSKYSTDNKTIFVDREYKSFALFLTGGKLNFIRIDQ